MKRRVSIKKEKDLSSQKQKKLPISKKDRKLLNLTKDKEKQLNLPSLSSDNEEEEEEQKNDNLKDIDNTNLKTEQINLLKKTEDKKINEMIQENQIVEQISLSDLIVLNCPRKCVYNSFKGKRFNIKNYVKHKDDKITFISGSEDELQYYLDYNLSFNKKYIILFQFDILPETQFTLTVSKKTNLLSRIAYDEPNSYFAKTFYPRWQPGQDECSNVIKGIDNFRSPQLGSVIEMRISLQDNNVEYTDYPNRININSNFPNFSFVNDDDPYVIGLTLCNQQQISILSFMEVTEFQY